MCPYEKSQGLEVKDRASVRGGVSTATFYACSVFSHFDAKPGKVYASAGEFLRRFKENEQIQTRDPEEVTQIAVHPTKRFFSSYKAAAFPDRRKQAIYDNVRDLYVLSNARNAKTDVERIFIVKRRVFLYEEY